MDNFNEICQDCNGNCRVCEYMMLEWEREEQKVMKKNHLLDYLMR